MTFLKILGVMALSALELWAGVPAGLALGLSPWLVFVVVSVGAAAGTALVIFAGKKIRALLLRKKKNKKARARKHYKTIKRIWKKYGILGLGLLAPAITGAPLGAAIGLALGADAKRLFVWFLAGIVVWTGLLVLLSSLGISLVTHSK